MPKTVKEMKQEAIEAREFYQFFKNHPDLSCQANEQVLRGFLDDQLLPINLPNLEASVLAVGHQLAVTRTIAPATPAPQPPSQPSETVKERKPPRPTLIGESKLSADQLKRVLTRSDFVQPVPAEFTRNRITAMSATELRSLTKKYGVEAVTSALNK